MLSGERFATKQYTRTRRSKLRASISSSHTALRFITQEETLLPILACNEDFSVPAGFRRQEIEGWENWAYYLEPENDNYDCVIASIFEQQDLVDVGTANLIRQGVLVLRPFGSDEFEPTAGEEVENCSVAFVKSNLCDVFIRTFGGRQEETAVAGWSTIRGSRIRILDDPPDE